MSRISITFAIVLFITVLFIWGRAPVVLVVLGCSLALYATGVLTRSQALAAWAIPWSSSSPVDTQEAGVSSSSSLTPIDVVQP